MTTPKPRTRTARATSNGRVTPAKAKPVVLSLDDLTIDDLCLLEEKLPAEALASITAGKPNLHALRGLVWLGLRAQNPAATLEDAGRVKISALPGPEG